MPNSTIIDVITGDVLSIECDILIMKFAQGFYGADLAVARALGLSETENATLEIGKVKRVPTLGRISCKQVMFVGVPNLRDFSYADIRNFSRFALNFLNEKECDIETIAMTIHGIGYGLDEREAFTAQIAGILEFICTPITKWKPKAIYIVERDTARAERLARFLEQIQGPLGNSDRGASHSPNYHPLPDAGNNSTLKKHVFVAMPYDEEMEDVYEFGICEPVNAAGCLCERCDRTVFTGDVLVRIRNRIETATMVLADVTGANPNVYLEIGYAWGRGIPTLLVAKKGQELLFDLKTHRCIFYKNILDLRCQLADIMSVLAVNGARDALGNL
jgi:hypothetical protein